MPDLIRDARLALRSFGRSPLFTATAVVTLALGIGATTAIFSAVNRILLHPLPFRGGDRLVYVWRQNPNASFMVTPSAGVVAEWLHGTRSTLEGIQPLDKQPLDLESGGETRRIVAEDVRPSFLSFLGVAPALGRGFAADEARPGGAAVVMLGHAFWMSRFGGRKDVLGRTIRLDGVPAVVVGVMPARLALFEEADVWRPLRLAAADTASFQGYQVLARLRPGATPEAAGRELDALAARVPAGPFSGWKTRLLRPQHFLDDTLQRGLPILFGAVAFVLLLACANVGLLLLARGAGRRREIGIRLALGAGRRRIARQLVVEAMCLAGAGGALGLVLAWWGVRALSALRPESLPELEHIGMDGHVIVAALLLAVLAALLAGAFPALRASDVAPADALRAGARAGGGGSGSGRGRSAIVAFEMMLSIVLLVSAGLLVRSLIARQRADLGFRAEGLLTVRTTLPKAGDAGAVDAAAFDATLLARVRGLPGITGATIATGAPPQYGVMGLGGWESAGEGALGERAPRQVAVDMVRPDFFRVLGIPLVAGRTFTEAEDEAGASVAVISRGLATRLFPGESALGRRLRSGAPAAGPGGGRSSAPRSWVTVIGVARDVAGNGIAGDARHLQWYSPYGKGPRLPGAPPLAGLLIVRTSGRAAALAPLIRGIVRSIDPHIPAPEIATVPSKFAERLAGPRFETVLLGLFAALALALAAIALFGVLSYAVAQRTRELGIRVALGAQSHDVRALVVRQGMLPALAGLTLGIGVALVASRLLRGLLYGVEPTDATAFAAAAAVLAATALAACYIPARRATRVDPIVALRAE